MKQYIIVIVCLFLSTQLFAQKSSLNDFFQQYEDAEGFTSIKIPMAWISSLASKDLEAGEKEVLKQLNSLKILTYEAEGKNSRELTQYADEFEQVIKGLDFEDLLVIKKKGEDVRFKIREENGKVKELLMLVKDKTDLVCLSLLGNLDRDNLSDLNINIDGMEHLKGLK